MNKILQLSSDFQYQALYPNLIKGLSDEGFEQIVFLQKRDDKPYIELSDVNNVTVLQSFRHKAWMKILFKKRISAIRKDIEHMLQLSEVTLTVSYFLFSDGAVANELFKRHGIPFVVAIRNSDVNHYFKYRFWLKGYIKGVFLNASRIIFPSPSYIKIIEEIVGKAFFEQHIRNKIEVVGNIIHNRWFKNVKNKEKLTGEINLLYAGEFSKNKRLEAIISSFDLFSKKYKARLFLVGNYGDNVVRINDLAARYESIDVVNRVEDVDRLISIFDKCHVFMMPSKTETFGNVYVEAMARGLPVVYTKGQGIDGYFPDGLVGYGVNEPLDRNIFDALEKIISDYNTLSLNAIESSRHFTKEVIVEKYLDIFKKVVDR